MFKVLGVDQKEYGPVSEAQVKEWIAQGRANTQTKVQPEGSTDWKPLTEFPEFAEALRASALPPQARLVPPGAAAPLPAAVSAKTSALAITSLVLGILGMFSCGATALVGLVLGIIALVKIDKSRGQLGGKGLAIAGMIVSGVFLLMLPMMAAMLLPALARAKERAIAIRCMNNVKQLNLGLTMYAADNNDQFPSGNKWCDAIQQYIGRNPSVFLCGSGDPTLRSHYAFNARLSGHSTKDVTAPASTVLVFETEGGWNLSGGKELLLSKPRHRTVTVGFVDGHVEEVRPEALEEAPLGPVGFALAMFVGLGQHGLP